MQVRTGPLLLAALVIMRSTGLSPGDRSSDRNDQHPAALGHNLVIPPVALRRGDRDVPTPAGMARSRRALPLPSFITYRTTASVYGPDRSSDRPAASRDHCAVGRPLVRNCSPVVAYGCGQPVGESSQVSCRPYTVRPSRW